MSKAENPHVTVEQVFAALQACYDPCCKERTVSIVELGLIQGVQVAENGQDVRMDDPRVAYPIFAKALELGITTIGVHKGVPLGPQPIEHTQAWDMDGTAANFPDINFIIFHVGLLFIDEICWQLVRYPNLYASIAATLNFIVRSPRARRLLEV